MCLCGECDLLVSDEKSKCQHCGCEISGEDQYILNGLTLCDDCYLEESNPVKACNPLAVYSAKRFRILVDLKVRLF